MSEVLLSTERHWVCPHCIFTDVTHGPPNETRMHSCKGMALMSMPMVPDGVKCKIETAEREDYVGGELVQTDAEGRPKMNARVTREDGEDLFVFAPVATTKIRSRE